MLTRGLVAVVEHGLFATANFVLNVLLARWLLAEEYGYFAAMFAVLIGIAAVAWAFWIALAMWLYRDWGKKRRT